jgi:hypothetical protein
MPENRPICKTCGSKMFKSGFRWSGQTKRQSWSCSNKECTEFNRPKIKVEVKENENNY